MTLFKKLTGPALGLALGALPMLAAAHVTASPEQAPAGGHQVVAFRVGHGCKGSATIALRIEIPVEVASAKPRAKPGWTVEITKVAGADGKDRASAVTWRGNLPDDQFDDFEVLLSLPPGAQTLYFPTVQTCETGEARWTQIPAEPAMTGLESPAPSLTLTPATGMPQHHH